MCIAVPARVVEIKGLDALVEVDGIRFLVNIELLSGVEAGDYLLIHAGCAIQKFEQKVAEKTIQLLMKLSLME